MKKILLISAALVFTAAAYCQNIERQTGYYGNALPGSNFNENYVRNYAAARGVVVTKYFSEYTQVLADITEKYRKDEEEKFGSKSIADASVRDNTVWLRLAAGEEIAKNHSEEIKAVIAEIEEMDRKAAADKLGIAIKNKQMQAAKDKEQGKESPFVKKIKEIGVWLANQDMKKIRITD